MNIIDVDCFGENIGVIVLIVNGGIGGFYSYNWNNNVIIVIINNFVVGNYIVIVIDMGSGGLIIIVIYMVDGLFSVVFLSGGVIVFICLNGINGVINLNIFGGNLGYIILWDSGI